MCQHKSDKALNLRGRIDFDIVAFILGISVAPDQLRPGRNALD